MTTDDENASRRIVPVMFKCDRCHYTERHDLTVKLSWMQAGRERFQFHSDNWPGAYCPKCPAHDYGPGSPWYPKVVRGKFSEKHTCGDACRDATSTNCTCSCAGANHGANRRPESIERVQDYAR